MADEELEKEAEEYALGMMGNEYSEFTKLLNTYTDAYKDGYAQGQQELMASNEVVKRGFADNLEEEIAELEAQNKELQARLDLSEENVMRQQEVIEKMKCCGNCKHFDTDYDYSICDKWKLAE